MDLYQFLLLLISTILFHPHPILSFPFTLEMEYPGIEVDAVTSGIQRRVKDRIAKTKLSVSLASKIKTKLFSKYLL
jgi:hypothetical protein